MTTLLVSACPATGLEHHTTLSRAPVTPPSFTSRLVLGMPQLNRFERERAQERHPPTHTPTHTQTDAYTHTDTPTHTHTHTPTDAFVSRDTTHATHGDVLSFNWRLFVFSRPLSFACCLILLASASCQQPATALAGIKKLQPSQQHQKDKQTKRRHPATGVQCSVVE